MIGTAASFVLLHGVEGLRNVRDIPSETRTTYQTLLSWYYDDEAWTGTWSSREEGEVEDLYQAEQPLSLSITASGGKVSGEMFNRAVCDLNPLLPPVLIEGEIRRGRLLALAYVFVGGEKRGAYTFEAERLADDRVITMSPLNDKHGLLPPTARLVRRIEVQGSGDSESKPHPDLECPISPLEFMENLRRQRDGADEGSR